MTNQNESNSGFLKYVERKESGRRPDKSGKETKYASCMGGISSIDNINIIINPNDTSSYFGVLAYVAPMSLLILGGWMSVTFGFGWVNFMRYRYKK